jgi:hypothetical protein
VASAGKRRACSACLAVVVSCPKVGDCVAIGNTGAVTASSPLGQLSGYWNGKTWKLSAA